MLFKKIIRKNVGTGHCAFRERTVTLPYQNLVFGVGYTITQNAKTLLHESPLSCEANCRGISAICPFGVGVDFKGYCSNK